MNHDADPRWIDAITAAFPQSQRKFYRDGLGHPAFNVFHVFPAGYIQSPQAHARTQPAFWQTPGSKIMAALLVAMGGLGCLAMRGKVSLPRATQPVRPVREGIVPRPSAPAGHVAQPGGNLSLGEGNSV